MGFRGKNPKIEKTFSGKKTRSFFKKYLFAVLSVEVGIFVICWVYQLGLFAEDRMDPATRPFPWQSYFLFAFLIPVCMTFFMGLWLEFRERYRKRKRQQEEEFSFLEYQRPILKLLLLFLVATGFIYFLDEILDFLAKTGGTLGRFFFLAVTLVIINGFVICVIWIFARYRSEKENLQNHYRAKILLLSMVEGEDIEASSGKFSENPSSGAPPAAGRMQEEDC